MSFARPTLLAQQLPALARGFASTSAPAAAKFSPLHKTTLARADRAAKGLGSKGNKTENSQRMSLDEAAKVLQVSSNRQQRSTFFLKLTPSPTLSQAWSPATPNAAYEINIQTKPSATVQLNALRGRVFLPHSCASATKQSILVVFASGAQAAAARAAGADVVGSEDLIPKLLDGSLVPDKLITTPELQGLFQRNPALARTLGPRGLMPSAKRGTVAEDIEQAVKEARGGLDWKGDSKGVIRAAIGRVSGAEPATNRKLGARCRWTARLTTVPLYQLHFTPDALQDNVHTLLASISDIALGGTGAVNGVPARTKRRTFLCSMFLTPEQGMELTP